MERSTSSTTILSRVLRAGDPPVAASICAACGTPGIKVGTRATRLGTIQKYYCKKCRRNFGASPMPRRRYSPAAILNAVTSYNLGRTIEQTRIHVSRLARGAVPASTLHAWIGQFASICTFARLRKRFSISPDTVLRTRTFEHKQEYKFAFHRLKPRWTLKTGH